MRARDRPGFLVPLVLCVAWAPAALPCSGDAAADSAVRAVVEGLIAADNARNIGRVLDSYAADAVLMPPNEPPLTQRAELEALYRALFDNFDPRIEGHVDEVCVDGALAVVRGRNGGSLAGRDGRESRRLDDVYLMVLRREGANGWLISRLIWHPASALER